MLTAESEIRKFSVIGKRGITRLKNNTNIMEEEELNKGYPKELQNKFKNSYVEHCEIQECKTTVKIRTHTFILISNKYDLVTNFVLIIA